MRQFIQIIKATYLITLGHHLKLSIALAGAFVIPLFDLFGVIYLLTASAEIFQSEYELDFFKGFIDPVTESPGSGLLVAAMLFFCREAITILVSNYLLLIIPSIVLDIRMKVVKNVIALKEDDLRVYRRGMFQQVVLNEIGSVVKISRQAVLLIASFFSVVILTLILYDASLEYFFLMCLFIPAFVILRYVISRILHQYEEKGLDESYHLADIVKLYSQSLSSIRIAGKKHHYYDKIERLSSRALRLRMKAQMVVNWDRLSVYVLLIGVILALQTASAFGVIPGIVAFIPYLLVIYRLTSAFNQFASLINEVVALEPRVKSVQKAFFVPEEKLERTNGLSPAITLDSILVSDVSFGYQGGDLLFSKLNLSFHKGKKYLLICDSGLGKSTIVKLLFGLYEPHQGSIALNTADGSRLEYAELSLDFIRSQYLYIHQSEIIASETVREYIAAGDDISQECIWKILDRVGMHNIVESFSGGIDETIGVNGRLLSGGQFQLLQLARALLSNKRVIILDEVSNSLDSSRRVAFQKLISEKAKHGHIIIEISHSSEGLAYADVVYNLPSA